eukprot:2438014-Pyramimonas_sp.AAC.1
MIAPVAMATSISAPAEMRALVAAEVARGPAWQWAGTWRRALCRYRSTPRSGRARLASILWLAAR